MLFGAGTKRDAASGTDNERDCSADQEYTHIARRIVTDEPDNAGNRFHETDRGGDHADEEKYEPVVHKPTGLFRGKDFIDRAPGIPGDDRDHDVAF